MRVGDSSESKAKVLHSNQLCIHNLLDEYNEEKVREIEMKKKEKHEYNLFPQSKFLKSSLNFIHKSSNNFFISTSC